MAKATSAAKAATPKGSKKNKKLTLMIIPFVILVFLFSYFPLHAGFMHSTITNRRFHLANASL